MRVKDIFKPEDVEKIVSSLQPLTDMLIEYQQTMSKLAQAVEPYITEVCKIEKNLRKAFKQWNSYFIQAFVDTGLIISPSAMRIPNEAIAESVHAYMSGDKSSIDRLLVGFFSNNNFSELDKMIKGWQNKKEIVPRINIISAAVDAFKSDNHYLSIPALLAQIEGIVYKVYAPHGKPDIKSARVNFNGLINMRKGAEVVFITKDHLILKILDGVINSCVYVSTDSPKRDKSKSHILNRHGILHGHEFDYASKENALRCFLVLDFLSDFDKSKTPLKAVRKKWQGNDLAPKVIKVEESR